MVGGLTAPVRCVSRHLWSGLAAPAVAIGVEAVRVRASHPDRTRHIPGPISRATRAVDVVADGNTGAVPGRAVNSRWRRRTVMARRWRRRTVMDRVHLYPYRSRGPGSGPVARLCNPDSIDESSDMARLHDEAEMRSSIELAVRNSHPTSGRRAALQVDNVPRQARRDRAGDRDRRSRDDARGT